MFADLDDLADLEIDCQSHGPNSESFDFHGEIVLGFFEQYPNSSEIIEPKSELKFKGTLRCCDFRKDRKNKKLKKLKKIEIHLKRTKSTPAVTCSRSIGKVRSILGISFFLIKKLKEKSTLREKFIVKVKQENIGSACQHNVLERRFFHVSKALMFFFNFCIYCLIEKLTGFTVTG